MAAVASSLSPLAGALIPVAGVIVGGLIGIAGPLLQERGRARREREAGEVARRRQTKLAVRLVVEELAEVLALIEEAAASRRYWVAPRQLPTETWNQYRTDIATTLESSLDWRRVTEAYDSINNLNWTVNHRRATDSDTQGHLKGFRILPGDQTRAAWRDIRCAVEVLEVSVGVAPDLPASRLDERQEVAGRRLWPFGDGDDFDVEGYNEAVEREAHAAAVRRGEEGW